jgi:2'-5' RNA ligase
MYGCEGQGSKVNSFALVSYLPDPLASFLNTLRNDLVSQCHSRAHVTVLPPRPLLCTAGAAWDQLQQRLQEVHPFRIELGEIKVFPVTDVIYLSVDIGELELQMLHTTLNVGKLAFDEPFTYHPHLTLAQEITCDKLAAATQLATRRWRDFAHSRSFMVEQLTFVQNTLDNCWMDLNAFQLSGPVGVNGGR